MQKLGSQFVAESECFAVWFPCLSLMHNELSFATLQVYQHSGVWELNKVTGKMNWSDTGSEDFDSKGDIVKVRA